MTHTEPPRPTPMDTRQIQIKDYQYELPEARIAKYPLPRRDQSKLLVYRRGAIEEKRFSDLPELLPAGTLLVYNNTRVIFARLHFRKETGALIEVFCLEPFHPSDYALSFQQKGSVEWLCMIGNLKKWKGGTLKRTIGLADGRTVELRAERGECRGTSHVVRFSWDGDPQPSWAELLDAAGELPIPPYLNRESEERDKETYQTVYSRIKGSVAAPTAGLHFTPGVLEALDRKGVERCELTLHVGAGTFRPVKSESIGQHDMHTEWISISREALLRLIAHGAQATAVGTTSVRTLESLYYIGCILHRNPDATGEELHIPQWMPYEEGKAQNGLPPTEALQAIADYLDRHGMEALHSATQILIAPGYKYHIVQKMITNFHQPQSTLLLLVSAFIGDDWRKVYDYALQHGFRFLSYGDSSLLIP